jgi:hypothetical protein
MATTLNQSAIIARQPEFPSLIMAKKLLPVSGEKDRFEHPAK